MQAAPDLTTFLPTLGDVAAVSLWVVDSRMCVTFVHGSYLSDLAGGMGVKPGDDLQLILPSDDAIDRLLALHLAALSGTSGASDHEWNERVYRVRIDPERGPDGKVRACVGVAIDISDQKESQRQLLRVRDEFERRTLEGVRAQEARRLFAATVEQSTDAVAITAATWTDEGPEIAYVNPAFIRTSGFSAGDAVGAPIGILRDETTAPLAWEELRTAVRSGASKQIEIILHRRGGPPYPALWSCSPIRDEAGRITHFVMTHRDVTEKRDSELALRESEEQLRQSQRMEAVGRLAGGIAHDFNNLLAVILAYTTLLRDALPHEDPARSDLEEIRRAGERAGTLTRQLLSFSSKQVVQPILIDANVAVGDVVRMLRRLLGEGVVIESSFQPGLPCVRMGRGQVEQILVNLAVNARDAMAGGGVLSISTALLETVPPGLRAPNAGSGPSVLLTVTDSGAGMSRETMLHIFEPFYTTKEPGKGTGLGLSTVYGIVQQNSGAIAVESELGAGTTFRIILPAASSVRATRDSSAEELGGPGGSETILVVEDDEMVRHLVFEILQRSGYNVVIAASPNEAKAIVANRAGEIALLLTDMVLPEMSGKDLGDLLLPMSTGMRVAYMSGYADDEAVQSALDGGTPFLAKPFSSEALLRFVRRALEAIPSTTVVARM